MLSESNPFSQLFQFPDRLLIVPIDIFLSEDYNNGCELILGESQIKDLLSLIDYLRSLDSGLTAYVYCELCGTDIPAVPVYSCSVWLNTVLSIGEIENIAEKHNVYPTLIEYVDRERYSGKLCLSTKSPNGADEPYQVPDGPNYLIDLYWE